MPLNYYSLTPDDLAAFPPPNYASPENMTFAIPLLSVLYPVVSFMFLARIWTRISWPTWRQNTLGIDDLLLFLGWVCASALAFIGLVAAFHFYACRHLWDIPRQDWPNLLLCFYVGLYFFISASTFIKVSILLFYYRLTHIAVSKALKWVNWAVITIVVLYNFVMAVECMAGCRPVEAYWRSLDPNWDQEWHCTETSVNNIIAGTCAVLTDLYAVLFPMFVTRKLPMDRRRRIGLNVIFALGLVTVGISSLRTYYHWEMAVQPDIARTLYATFTNAQLELFMGIACASAPATRIFYKRYLCDIRIRWPCFNAADTSTSSTFPGGSLSVRTTTAGQKLSDILSSRTGNGTPRRMSSKLTIRTDTPPLEWSRESMDRIIARASLSPRFTGGESEMLDREAIYSTRHVSAATYCKDLPLPPKLPLLPEPAELKSTHDRAPGQRNRYYTIWDLEKTPDSCMSDASSGPSV